MDNPSLNIPTRDIGIKDNLSYEENPIQVLDRQICKFRTKNIASVKVLWRNQFVEETTWEDGEDMKKSNPHLFAPRQDSIKLLILFLVLLSQNIVLSCILGVWVGCQMFPPLLLL